MSKRYSYPLLGVNSRPLAKRADLYEKESLGAHLGLSSKENMTGGFVRTSRGI